MSSKSIIVTFSLGPDWSGERTDATHLTSVANFMDSHFLHTLAPSPPQSFTFNFYFYFLLFWMRLGWEHWAGAWIGCHLDETRMALGWDLNETLTRPWWALMGVDGRWWALMGCIVSGERNTAVRQFSASRWIFLKISSSHLFSEKDFFNLFFIRFFCKQVDFSGDFFFLFMIHILSFQTGRD